MGTQKHQEKVFSKDELEKLLEPFDWSGQHSERELVEPETTFHLWVMKLSYRNVAQLDIAQLDV